MGKKERSPWIRPTAMALGLPSTMLGSAWFFYHLIHQGFLPDWLGWTLCILTISGFLFLLVYYGSKNSSG